LVCEEPRTGTCDKTFIPVLIVGAKAEDLAETLEAADQVLLEGSLAYRAGKAKGRGTLVVTCDHVEVLVKAAGVEV
jgi:single-stranded DNA-binding protein